MKKFISTDTQYLPFLARAINFGPSALARCIVCTDETGRPVAGVIYDGYNGHIIHAHIWVDAEATPSREWFAAIFDYPFNKLQVHKIIGQVAGTNEQAQRLDEHFGFVLEAEVVDYFDGGDSLLVYTMTRDQCRVLNSPRWATTVKRVGG